MANTLYANKLKQLLENPGSFSGSPGFQFALNTGLQGVDRSASARGMRGSGNALAALSKYGSDLATQDYGATVDRLGRLTGQEQQYDLGLESNRLTGVRDANAMTLGTEANRNTATANATNARRTEYDYTLGREANTNTAQRNKWDYEIGGRTADNTAARTAADYDLGEGQLDATRERNWWDYDLGQGRLGLDSARAENDYNLNWFNAGTNRGTARSVDWGRRDDSRRAWRAFDPPRRIA